MPSGELPTDAGKDAGASVPVRFLTRQRFIAAVRDAMGKAGVECSRYCGHSFRIGAVTTAAARGMEDSIIKTLGRWKSLAYLQYVKIPKQQLASYSASQCLMC